MRIGLDLLYLLPGVVGGTETYAAGLLQGLSQLGTGDEFFVFVNRESSEWKLPESTSFHRVVCPVRAASRARRYFYEQVVFPRLARECRLDVMHGLGYVIPLSCPHPSVVSILDIVYDNPGTILRRSVLRYFLSRSARRATRILTLSLNSKKQIVSRLGVPPEKIAVTYLAPKIRGASSGTDWFTLKSRLAIRDSYLLAVSSSSPHKNIPALIRAFHDVIRERSGPPQLVLAGHLPAQGTALRDLVASLGLEPHVVFTGYLTDGDLDLLYAHALFFVFPSLYEGFGLPVLEAMSHGTPVACSNAASLPEVAGDAAVLFDPRSPAEIQCALRDLLDSADLRATLARRSYDNVSRFSWRNTADETMRAYRDAVSSGCAGP